MFRPIVCLLPFLTIFNLDSAIATGQDAFRQDRDGFRKTLVPFLKQHCLKCHSEQKPEGDFRVDEPFLSPDFVDAATSLRWAEVVNVLNSHQMPPTDEPQPTPAATAGVVDWIVDQAARAQMFRRDVSVVLRRMNRTEYGNTIRDLTGVDFDVSGIPEDPSAGGFDNNGGALTMSPLHMELFYASARKILDEALVEGEQPPSLKWRIEPDSGDSDSNRVTYDGQRIIVNGGRSRVENGFKVMHHESWDRKLNARDFALPHAGEYLIRIRAGSVVPTREQVVESARGFLKDRLDKQMQKNGKGEQWHREAMERDLQHFQTDRMYDYGPPRLKVSINLGGQPRVIDEFDVPASIDEPGIYEVRAFFTTERAGITLEYAYSVPKELENFWMQNADEFARPEVWVDWFELEGPIQKVWPPASHELLLKTDLPDSATEQERAEMIIRRFMTRAWRRPVTNDEVATKLELFRQVRPDKESFIQAIKTPLTAVLVSPHFLYLTEPSPEESVAGSRPLNSHELATRLSYFLWSTLPDDELTMLADRNLLVDSETGSVIRTAQVDRLLADQRSAEFVSSFAGQWLGLREVGANPPAADLYPRYDRHLEESIVEESKAFFAEILHNDLNVMNFVHSDFVVINERLARYYGIPGVKGDHFRKVRVPQDIRRGGILTQASVLTITSNGTRTSPVKRGTWILKNVLGTDPGLPVANAGEIAPKVPGIDKATVRQRLEIHRELPQCARCHDRIDPLGFALENFNAAGDWREQEGFGYKGRIGRDDPVIDATSQLPDGTQINGIQGLQAALLQKEDLFLK
ncbi:MAG: DUF1592 domain-containing protein, partial [Planctomycetaceae bacterium]|nr:DUF1592 domain-containing protein [Planctomycetaceae bacterium]